MKRAQILPSNYLYFPKLPTSIYHYAQRRVFQSIFNYSGYQPAA